VPRPLLRARGVRGAVKLRGLILILRIAEELRHLRRHARAQRRRTINPGGNTDYRDQQLAEYHATAETPFEGASTHIRLLKSCQSFSYPLTTLSAKPSKAA